MLHDHHPQVFCRQPRISGLVRSDLLLEDLARDLFKLGVQPLEPLRKSFWRRWRRHVRLGLFDPHC